MTSVVNEQVNPGGELKSHPFSGSLQMHSMTDVEFWYCFFFAMDQAIVLLIILISGICCMMGIDTPTRFETPQES